MLPGEDGEHGSDHAHLSSYSSTFCSEKIGGSSDQKSEN